VTAMTAMTARQRLLGKAKVMPAPQVTIIEPDPIEPAAPVVEPAVPVPYPYASLWLNLEPGERRILDLETGCEWSEYPGGITKTWR